ncbi:MAG: hypothetical protein WD333_11370 [Dehalococcoidia bacterium]
MNLFLIHPYSLARQFFVRPTAAAHARHMMFFALAVLALAVAGSAASTFISADHGSHHLLVSTSPDRSGAQELDGASVSGDIYIFVAPESGTRGVSFWIDNPDMSGDPDQFEGRAPYDLAATAPDGTALPLDSSTLGEGSHSVTVHVQQAGRVETVVEATFTVGDGATSDVTPTPTATATPPDTDDPEEWSVGTVTVEPAIMPVPFVGELVYTWEGFDGVNEHRYTVDWQDGVVDDMVSWSSSTAASGEGGAPHAYILVDQEIEFTFGLCYEERPDLCAYDTVTVELMEVPWTGIEEHIQPESGPVHVIVGEYLNDVTPFEDVTYEWEFDGETVGGDMPNHSERVSAMHNVMMVDTAGLETGDYSVRFRPVRAPVESFGEWEDVTITVD